MGSDARSTMWPLGATVTLDELEDDPHPVHHRLREREPVSWLGCLDGWLVTSHPLALEAMRDARTYTVDDPRFSTAQVIGPSMLSLDGDGHARHRAPFVAPFRAAQVSDRFAGAAAERARALLAPMRTAGRGELRRGFAGPMAAGIVARALGMADGEVEEVLGAYDAIVGSVTAISAGRGPTAAGTRAFAALRALLEPVIDGRRGDSLLAAAAGAGAAGAPRGGATRPPGGATRLPGAATAAPGTPALTHDEIASNAAVLLFGGIETTEGMIANAALEIMRGDGVLERVRDDPAALDAAIDESLRLEPAAAVVDRYATRDATLGAARIARGDLVRLSIAAANRDPSIFEEPDRFRLERTGLRRHLAFAHGPHVCVGVHLARLEARAALGELVALPGLRLDPASVPDVRGLIFRKPVRLDALWDVPSGPSAVGGGARERLDV